MESEELVFASPLSLRILQQYRELVLDCPAEISNQRDRRIWRTTAIAFCASCSQLSFAIVVIRVIYVLYWTGKPIRPSTSHSLRTLIVLGSGGHTAEMLSITNVLQKDKYSLSFYIVAATNYMSLQKAQVLEESLLQQGENIGRKMEGAAQFIQIYRSREVGQSYIISIGTTLIATAHALWLILRIRPQMIICNGPGICIPLCASEFLFKLLGLGWSHIFYIESIARVRKLSLSSLLLYKSLLADQFYVQWPQFQKKYPRAHCVGCLM